MSPYILPEPGVTQGPALRTVREYAQILATIRLHMGSPRKHSENAALAVTAFGFTTTPIHLEGGLVFEITLDLMRHQLQILNNTGGVWTVPFYEQSPKELLWQIENIMTGNGVSIDTGDYVPSTEAGEYDRKQAQAILLLLTQVDGALKHFMNALPGNTRPVLLWPERYTLESAWMHDGGLDRKTGEGNAEPTGMQFGFSFGDENTNEPYFYCSVTPWKDGILNHPLPGGAEWLTDGWNAAVWRFANVIPRENISESVRTFYTEWYQSALELIDGVQTP